MEKIKNPLVFAIFCWLISILVRWDVLQRPLQTHQEDVNAHVLVTLRNWEQNGFFNHHGNLVLTPNIEADKNFQANPLVQVFDNQGFGYYISYPPMAFYLPFFVSKTSGIPISAGLLRFLSLLVHLFCILLIIHWLKSKSLPISDQIINLGILFWFFSPGTLWFFGNIWFSDILVILFCILVIVRKDKPDQYLWLFLGLWTEWFAFALGLVLGLDALWNKNWKKSLILMFLAIFALSTWVYLYSLPAGFQAFWKALTFKMEQRSGLTEIADNGLSYSSLTAWKFICWYYFRHYFFIIIFITFNLFYKKFKNIEINRVNDWRFYFWAVLIHHFLLFNWTAVHDFSVLKSAPLLIVFLMVSCNYLEIKKLHIVFLGFILIANIFWYYRQNELKYFNPQEMQSIYEQIKKSDRNQRVRLETEIPKPYLWYYGGRLVGSPEKKNKIENQ